MGSVSKLRPTPQPTQSCTTSVLCYPHKHSCSFSFNSLSFPSGFPSPGTIKWNKKTAHTRYYRSEPVCVSSTSSSSRNFYEFDVVIIGAGIIGLSIARQFLTGSDLSVAVVDKAVPCSGATGAGQGYIWMAHKTPGSDLWGLAMRSKKLWELLAASLCDQGLDPLEALGWKKTGSLLVGRTPEELDLLKRRVNQLSEAGLRAEYLSGSDLLSVEPALMVGESGGAAFIPDDCQLDAHRTVAFIEEANRRFVPQGRYAEFYHNPVKCLLRSNGTGEIKAVETSKNTLYSKKAIVIAAGSWSGSLMSDLASKSEVSLDVPIKPRKGHLLVLEDFSSLQLNHGLMEIGYTNYQTATSLHNQQSLSVSMTATMDTQGNLVLGSSRQFAGFNTEVESSIINSIWERASEFFPRLGELDLSDFQTSTKVRIGLRPYMPDGKPVIGSVPGLPNVFIAAGHEGGGLSMALGTAEMIADIVLGNPGKVDSAPFSMRGRCC